METPFRQLRYSHRADGELDIYMLFNEHVEETFSGKLHFAADHGQCLCYDPYTGKLTRMTDRVFTLAPYETRFVIFGSTGLTAE